MSGALQLSFRIMGWAQMNNGLTVVDIAPMPFGHSNDMSLSCFTPFDPLMPESGPYSPSQERVLAKNGQCLPSVDILGSTSVSRCTPEKPTCDEGYSCYRPFNAYSSASMIRIHYVQPLYVKDKEGKSPEGQTVLYQGDKKDVWEAVKVTSIAVRFMSTQSLRTSLGECLLGDGSVAVANALGMLTAQSSKGSRIVRGIVTIMGSKPVAKSGNDDDDDDFEPSTPHNLRHRDVILPTTPTKLRLKRPASFSVTRGASLDNQKHGQDGPSESTPTHSQLNAMSAYTTTGSTPTIPKTRSTLSLKKPSKRTTERSSLGESTTALPDVNASKESDCELESRSSLYTPMAICSIVPAEPSIPTKTAFDSNRIVVLDSESESDTEPALPQWRPKIGGAERQAERLLEDYPPSSAKFTQESIPSSQGSADDYRDPTPSQEVYHIGQPDALVAATDVSGSALPSAYLLDEVEPDLIYTGLDFDIESIVDNGPNECMICGKNLSHLDAARVEYHVNNCMDDNQAEQDAIQSLDLNARVQGYSSSQVAFAGEQLDYLARVKRCPICKQDWPLKGKARAGQKDNAPKKARQKVDHMKRCAKAHKRTVQSLLYQLRLLKERYERSLVLGTLGDPSASQHVQDYLSEHSQDDEHQQQHGYSSATPVTTPTSTRTTRPKSSGIIQKQVASLTETMDADFTSDAIITTVSVPASSRTPRPSKLQRMQEDQQDESLQLALALSLSFQQSESESSSPSGTPRPRRASIVWTMTPLPKESTTDGGPNKRKRKQERDRNETTILPFAEVQDLIQANVGALLFPDIDGPTSSVNSNLDQSQSSESDTSPKRSLWGLSHLKDTGDIDDLNLHEDSEKTFPRKQPESIPSQKALGRRSKMVFDKEKYVSRFMRRFLQRDGRALSEATTKGTDNPGMLGGDEQDQDNKYDSPLWSISRARRASSKGQRSSEYTDLFATTLKKDILSHLHEMEVQIQLAKQTAYAKIIESLEKHPVVSGLDPDLSDEMTMEDDAAQFDLNEDLSQDLDGYRRPVSPSLRYSRLDSGEHVTPALESLPDTGIRRFTESQPEQLSDIEGDDMYMDMDHYSPNIAPTERIEATFGLDDYSFPIEDTEHDNTKSLSFPTSARSTRCRVSTNVTLEVEDLANASFRSDAVPLPRSRDSSVFSPPSALPPPLDLSKLGYPVGIFRTRDINNGNSSSVPRKSTATTSAVEALGRDQISTLEWDDDNIIQSPPLSSIISLDESPLLRAAVPPRLGLTKSTRNAETESAACQVYYEEEEDEGSPLKRLPRRRAGTAIRSTGPLATTTPSTNTLGIRQYPDNGNLGQDEATIPPRRKKLDSLYGLPLVSKAGHSESTSDHDNEPEVIEAPLSPIVSDEDEVLESLGYSASQRASHSQYRTQSQSQRSVRASIDHSNFSTESSQARATTSVSQTTVPGARLGAKAKRGAKSKDDSQPPSQLAFSQSQSRSLSQGLPRSGASTPTRKSRVAIRAEAMAAESAKAVAVIRAQTKMPNYEAMSVARLRMSAATFGLKAGTKRSLVDQLTALWTSLKAGHGQTSTSTVQELEMELTDEESSSSSRPSSSTTIQQNRSETRKRQRFDDIASGSSQKQRRESVHMSDSEDEAAGLAGSLGQPKTLSRGRTALLPNNGTRFGRIERRRSSSMDMAPLRTFDKDATPIDDSRKRYRSTSSVDLTRNLPSEDDLPSSINALDMDEVDRADSSSDMDGDLAGPEEDEMKAIKDAYLEEASQDFEDDDQDLDPESSIIDLENQLHQFLNSFKQIRRQFLTYQLA
ncbi:hypothetical protein BGW38_003427 [Lunasporangiospora selenospora]|uniref:Uncharacterized protein n=1 Tax=Lunasporangiospora selenospora TaxID=979761 RepID=A0A9P6KHS3_9FUNG|nr:hypothetical protein BGW38_003427 [Lunasporangiospora selenospora]